MPPVKDRPSTVKAPEGLVVLVPSKTARLEVPGTALPDQLVMFETLVLPVDIQVVGVWPQAGRARQASAAETRKRISFMDAARAREGGWQTLRPTATGPLGKGSPKPKGASDSPKYAKHNLRGYKMN